MQSKPNVNHRRHKTENYSKVPEPPPNPILSCTLTLLTITQFKESASGKTIYPLNPPPSLIIHFKQIVYGCRDNTGAYY